jgi:hypothetical protein
MPQGAPYRIDVVGGDFDCGVVGAIQQVVHSDLLAVVWVALLWQHFEADRQAAQRRQHQLVPRRRQNLAHKATERQRERQGDAVKDTRMCTPAPVQAPTAPMTNMAALCSARSLASTAHDSGHGRMPEVDAGRELGQVAHDDVSSLQASDLNVAQVELLRLQRDEGRTHLSPHQHRHHAMPCNQKAATHGAGHERGQRTRAMAWRVRRVRAPPSPGR